MRKGIFEQPIISVFLVMLAVIIIVASIAFYLRALFIGQPIEIRTYAEYRWANYLPSAILFYLTYDKNNWKALNEIVLNSSSESETKIFSKEEFFSEYPDLLYLRYLITKLEDKLGKTQHTYFMEDSKGLIISIGLPKKYIVKKGVTVPPTEYPYECYSKSTPIFSKINNSNLRIKFVLCCKNIKSCEDYIVGPGSTVCEADPCEVAKTGGCKKMKLDIGKIVWACLEKNI